MRRAAALLIPLCLVACNRKEPKMADAGTTKPPTPVVKQPAPTPAKAESGIKVLLLSSPQKPIVNFRLLFLAGSIDDPKGKEGLTALTATLMVKGGTAELTSAELLARLFPMAAELEVQVEKEMTVLTGRVHKDHLARFLPLLHDVLLRPRFDPKELERLRVDAINDIEKRLRTSDDENLGKAALDWLLYEGHPYQHYVGGTVQGLRAITLDDIKAHARKVFTKARLVVGLAGGSDEGLAKGVQESLASLPAKGAERPSLPPPPSSKVRVLIVEKEASSTAISLGHAYDLTRASPDFTPMFVGNSAFGEHRQMGGRLFSQLREKRGLNYGDYAYVEHFVQDGEGTYPLPNVSRRQQLFQIWIRPVEHQNRLFALRAALYELQRLLKDGLAPEELDKTRGFLTGYTRMFEQTDMRRLGFALDDQFYGTKGFLERVRAEMPALKLEQVNEALRKHLDPAKLRIAIVTRNGEELRKQILSGKPLPIRYPTPKDKAVLEEDPKIEAFPLAFKPEEVVVVKVSELFEK